MAKYQYDYGANYLYQGYADLGKGLAGGVQRGLQTRRQNERYEAEKQEQKDRMEQLKREKQEAKHIQDQYKQFGEFEGILEESVNNGDREGVRMAFGGMVGNDWAKKIAPVEEWNRKMDFTLQKMDEAETVAKQEEHLAGRKAILDRADRLANEANAIMTNKNAGSGLQTYAQKKLIEAEKLRHALRNPEEVFPVDPDKAFIDTPAGTKKTAMTPAQRRTTQGQIDGINKELNRLENIRTVGGIKELLRKNPALYAKYKDMPNFKEVIQMTDTGKNILREFLNIRKAELYNEMNEEEIAAGRVKRIQSPYPIAYVAQSLNEKKMKPSQIMNEVRTMGGKYDYKVDPAQAEKVMRDAPEDIKGTDEYEAWVELQLNAMGYTLGD